jgi:HEAT repeat protein
MTPMEAASRLGWNAGGWGAAQREEVRRTLVEAGLGSVALVLDEVARCPRAEVCDEAVLVLAGLLDLPEAAGAFRAALDDDCRKPGASVVRRVIVQTLGHATATATGAGSWAWATTDLDDLLFRDPDPDVRSHAAWAIANIGVKGELTMLRKALGREKDPAVHLEIAAAIEDLETRPEGR